MTLIPNSTLLLLLLLCTACGSPSATGDAATLPNSNNDSGGIGPGPGPGADLTRGGEFFGVSEQFNRYYTDPSYESSRTIYVSRMGGGDGSSRDSPTSVDDGFAQVDAGEQITFLADSTPYEGCWELDGDSSGTYDAPIVIYAERNANGGRGVHINCCDTGRKTCFNLEFAHHVAVDGFILAGGDYGIRVVGEGYAPADNQVGIAMLNNEGMDQCADPIFSGQSSWIVVDGNVAHGAGSCDGHGIYLSNGGDYMLVRGNDIYGNESSDFQINADPIGTCEDEGIAYDDPICDGSTANGQGQGASEFILVENNYFHHGDGPGPNFTSVRHSVIRNNIIGPYAQHGTSFWQESDNPKLGSSNNVVHHNLFLGNGSRHILQFIENSGNNDVQNNLVIAIANRPVLLESDTTSNIMRNNYYFGDRFDGYTPNDDEHVLGEFDTSWFANFPNTIGGQSADFRPAAGAPFTTLGRRLEQTPTDMTGKERGETTSLGPIEP